MSKRLQDKLAVARDELTQVLDGHLLLGAAGTAGEDFDQRRAHSVL
jgi:hypothetical protein